VAADAEGIGAPGQRKRENSHHLAQEITLNKADAPLGGHPECSRRRLGPEPPMLRETAALELIKRIALKPYHE